MSSGETFDIREFFKSFQFIWTFTGKIYNVCILYMGVESVLNGLVQQSSN